MEISWEPSQLLFRTKTFQPSIYFSFKIFRKLLKKKNLMSLCHLELWKKWRIPTQSAEAFTVALFGEVHIVWNSRFLSLSLQTTCGYKTCFVKYSCPFPFFLSLDLVVHLVVTPLQTSFTFFASVFFCFTHLAKFNTI